MIRFVRRHTAIQYTRAGGTSRCVCHHNVFAITRSLERDHRCRSDYGLLMAVCVERDHWPGRLPNQRNLPGRETVLEAAHRKNP